MRICPGYTGGLGGREAIRERTGVDPLGARGLKVDEQEAATPKKLQMRTTGDWQDVGEKWIWTPHWQDHIHAEAVLLSEKLSVPGVCEFRIVNA